jgi:transposase InsO family protein
MGEHIDTSLVLKALGMAVLHRKPPAGLLIHSDRGVQYASADYRQALNHAGLIASMSRKANCYDNAIMESFWSTLKLELKSPRLRYPQPGSHRNLRLHRILLQSPPRSQRLGLPFTR